MQTIKIFQLAEGCFQANVGIPPHISTYVGAWDFVTNMVVSSGYKIGDVIPLAGIPDVTYQNCLHSFVEMGFTTSRLVCKICNEEKV